MKKVLLIVLVSVILFVATFSSFTALLDVFLARALPEGVKAVATSLTSEFWLHVVFSLSFALLPTLMVFSEKIAKMKGRQVLINRIVISVSPFFSLALFGLYIHYTMKDFTGELGEFVAVQVDIENLNLGMTVLIGSVVTAIASTVVFGIINQSKE